MEVHSHDSQYDCLAHAGRGRGPSGCATPDRQHEEAGMVIGGVLGGLLGTQVGSGRGREAAIIAGTLAGAAIGGSVGRSMD
jgi:uncharacterized protein YcfJ